MNIALWIAQILLAVLFAKTGQMKAFGNISDLSQMMPFAVDYPGLVRFIGWCEIAGALGLILPAATHIMPRLTPLAAALLAVVMVLAAVYHVARGEFSHLPMVLGLLAVCCFVAVGRGVYYPKGH